MKRFFALCVALLLFALPASAQENGEITLYGEIHAVKPILDRELELIGAFYVEQGGRHLFVELPYYTAELLNVWMRTGDEAIFDQIYADWEGSASHDEAVYRFYHAIRESYPQIVFHGTDVGHQYHTTGARYLEYLLSQGLEESEAYALTLENIEQGRLYYERGDDAYRENAMVENFLRAYESVEGACVMGIYGAAHTAIDAPAYRGEGENMVTQLHAVYGDALRTEDLSALAREIDPIRMDVITVSGKSYQAAYFGEQELSPYLPQYKSRAFWRLEDAYDDFKDAALTGNVLPQDNYPMTIQAGQVLIVDYTLADGSVEREYHRCDGTLWQGQLASVQIKVK